MTVEEKKYHFGILYSKCAEEKLTPILTIAKWDGQQDNNYMLITGIPSGDVIRMLERVIAEMKQARPLILLK